MRFNLFSAEQNLLLETFFAKVEVSISDFLLETESSEYGACQFLINDKKIVARIAKITPKKIGQFVTIWQRNQSGITEPFQESNQLDFIFIFAKQEKQFGVFVFPTNVLLEKGIIPIVLL
jgi:hypothetical protein